MKVKTLSTEQEKVVAKAIKDGYVMEDDDEVVSLSYEATEYVDDPEMDRSGWNKQESRVIQNPETQAEMAVPYGTPPKDIKLHKVPLSELNAELMHLRKKFTVRNGGMRSIPKSVRNRINRLEKVIGIKMEVYKRALEQLEQKNEFSSVSQNT